MEKQKLAGLSKDTPATVKPTVAAVSTHVVAGKRRRRVQAVPNLVKRRSINTTAKLQAVVKEAKSTDDDKPSTSGAAKQQQKQEQEQQKQKQQIDDDFTYMSDEGEGHYTGDTSELLETEDEIETEQALNSKINEVERKIKELKNNYDQEIKDLQMTLEPLTKSLKIKQEQRREEERKNLKTKTQKKLQQQQQVEQPQQKQINKQQQQQKQQEQQKQQQQKQQQQQQQQDQQQEQQQQQQQKQQQNKVLPRQSPIKKEKVPPINTYKMDLEDTITLCKSAIGNNFIIKRLNKDRHAIHCFTVKAHKIIKQLLKDSTTEFYSFTPKVEKTHSVLLKGLDSSTDPEAVLNELRLKATDDLDFISVKPFTTVRARREERKLPFFLVQISPSSKLDSLRSITVLNYQVVTWDKLKRHGDMLQCMRCQRFGHAAANCEMQSRCVKCGENHKSGECKLGNERVQDRAQLKCVLCRGDGHPANYRGCPKFQQMKHQKETRQTVVEQRPSGHAQTATIVTPQISYAQMASGKGNTRQPPPKVAQQAPVPKAPAVVAETDIVSLLLSMQGQLTGLQSQLTGLQGQIKEQTKRVDHLYSFLPRSTQLRS